MLHCLQNEKVILLPYDYFTEWIGVLRLYVRTAASESAHASK